MAHSSLNLTTLLTGALLAMPSANADRIADGGRSEAPAGVRSSGLRQSDAARLIKGELPTFDRLDAKYARRGNTIRCVDSWNKLRRQSVSVRPVRASLTLLRKNASAKRLSIRKLNNALAVYLKNQDKLPNQRYLTVVDFDKSAGEPRLFTVDLQTGSVDSFFVSSSYGSSPRADGWSTHFSNRTDESNANSLGCAVASGEYRGKFGRRSLILHGLESTNDNMCQRSIIMHKADYVGKGLARSQGCLAVKPTDETKIFDRVGGGGLICSYREGPIYQAAGNYRKRAPRHSHRATYQHRRSHRGLF